jgi:hypothetical protein
LRLKICVLADADECSSDTACGLNTICTNTPGSHTCACKPGYELLAGKDTKTDGCTGKSMLSLDGPTVEGAFNSIGAFFLIAQSVFMTE